MEPNTHLMEKPGVINGYLYCRKIGRDWKKRWCEIRNNKLYFFATPSPNVKNETGSIRLEDVVQILDAPKVEPPKIEGDNQMNLSNCCFEIQFPVKTATLFLSSTTPVNKEKWIHALTYSKYYHQNRLKLRHLFMNGHTWGLLIHGGSEPLGRKGFSMSKLISCSDIPRYTKTSNPAIASNSNNNSNNNINYNSNFSNTSMSNIFSLWVFGGLGSNGKLLNDLWELHFPNLTQESNCMWIKHAVRGAPTARSGHSMCEYGKILLIFGGNTQNGRSNEVFFFNTSTLEWSEPECIGEGPSPRDAHSAVIIADNLFIFGGRNESTIYNDLHILNLRTMSWINKTLVSAPMMSVSAPSLSIHSSLSSTIPFSGLVKGAPVGLCHHTCVAISNSILLIFGGFDGNNPSNKIYIYNVKLDIWSQPNVKGTPPPPRFLHSSIYVENKLVIHGGTDGESIFSDMYYFSPETMNWQQVITSGIHTPGKRFGHKLIAAEKFHFLFGGNNSDNSYPNDVLFLSTKSMETQWIDQMSLGLGTLYCYKCERKIVEESSTQLVYLIHPHQIFHDSCFHDQIEQLKDEILSIFSLPPKDYLNSKSDITILLSYVRFIVHQKDHPMSILIQKYIIDFNINYVLMYGTDPSLLLRKALDDIHSFLNNFADLIVLNLKLLDCTEGRLHCCIIAKKIILPAIYDRLFNIYLKCNVDADSKFTSIISKMQNINTVTLHLSNKILLEYEEHCGELAYKNCITVFEKLIEKPDPYQKLDALVSALHIAHYSISGFYYNTLSKKKDVFITADDLVPLFQFFLIKSKVSNIYSEISFIQDFLDVSLLNGEAAYCLTTLQVAVSATERIPTEAKFC